MTLYSKCPVGACVCFRRRVCTCSICLFVWGHLEGEESGGGGGGVLLGNGGSVSLEESVAEWLCTAAGSGLSASPPPAPLPLLPPQPPLPVKPLPPRFLPRTALQLPLLGNCLHPLPACSVIGRWHGGVPLPDPASCTDYCLLMFQHTPTPTHTPHPLTPVARLHIQASLPPGNFIGQSRMAQTCCCGCFWEVRQYEEIDLNNWSMHGRKAPEVIPGYQNKIDNFFQTENCLWNININLSEMNWFHSTVLHVKL